MSKRKKNNIYPLIFVFILTFTTASLLMGVQAWLSPRIKTNKKMEKLRSILTISGIDTDKINNSELEKIFNKTFSKTELKPGFWRYQRNSQNKTIAYIYPLQGKGLWGPVKGFLSTGPKKWKIKDLIITYQEETPGLGAEIATSSFYQKFRGKKITPKPDSSKIVLQVKKEGQTRNKNEVDGITGATQTSKRFNQLLTNSLKMIVEDRKELK
ncbi:MAG: FMN-binding protein [Deltaproteobacteria bacterium]|jgi:Na+-transporting NADH:ubiquinone oxidoreductase subunit C|nr:FMN-binding protein [Deltaproteobacteria bacterium]